MTSPEAVVVGGGLAGLAAAVAVARAGLETLHIAPKGPPDQRTSALMLPSVEYLRSAGLIAERAGATVTDMSGGPWFDVDRATKTFGLLAAPAPHHAELLRLAREPA